MATSPLWLPHLGLAEGFAQTSLPPAGADGWISLLNGRDLTGWYTMLQKSGKDVAQTRKIVVMEQEMLHILGNELTGEPVEPGYIATNQEFENVHIRVEYKWGVKRFPPRSESKRDNGILYGLVGEDKVWPRMVECQIEEGDVGDYFLVDGIRGIQARHDNGLFGQGLTSQWLERSTGDEVGRGASRAHDRPEDQRRQLRKPGRVECRRGDLAGRPIGAHRKRKDCERSLDAAAARSAKSGKIHPLDPRKNRHRNRIR